MHRKSCKENIDPGKKLPPLGKKHPIPKIRLDKLKISESPIKSYSESFISLNILSSKSPSSHRLLGCKCDETIVETSEVQKNIFCGSCSLNSLECFIF